MRTSVYMIIIVSSILFFSATIINLEVESETLNAEDYGTLFSEEDQSGEHLAADSIILMCADGRNHPDYPWALCDTDLWPYVSDNVDIVKIYIGDLNENTDPDKVRCFVEALKEKDIKIALEIGGLLDWHAHKGPHAAAYSFAEEYGQLKPFLELFEEDLDLDFIDLLELDCPVRRMLFPFDKKADYHTPREAVAELIKVIRLWQEVLPGADINLITNFPVWGWQGKPAYFSVDGFESGYGQYDLVLVEIIRQTDSAGLDIRGITIDNPFDYAISMAYTNQPQLISSMDWLTRILALEEMARRLGFEVNLIFNSELGGRSSNAMFHKHSLAFIDLYTSRGGNPDGYWLQSWYQYPDKWLPEDEPFTMTNLTREVIERLNEQAP